MTVSWWFCRPKRFFRKSKWIVTWCPGESGIQKMYRLQRVSQTSHVYPLMTEFLRYLYRENWWKLVNTPKTEASRGQTLYNRWVAMTIELYPRVSWQFNVENPSWMFRWFSQRNFFRWDYPRVITCNCHTNNHSFFVWPHDASSPLWKSGVPRWGVTHKHCIVCFWNGAT